MSGKLFFIFYFTQTGIISAEKFSTEIREAKRSIPFSSITGSRKKDISTQFFLFPRKILRETFYGTEMLFHLKNFLRRKTDSIIFC